jgi:hypothetical protein
MGWCDWVTMSRLVFFEEPVFIKIIHSLSMLADLCHVRFAPRGASQRHKNMTKWWHCCIFVFVVYLCIRLSPRKAKLNKTKWWLSCCRVFALSPAWRKFDRTSVYSPSAPRVENTTNCWLSCISLCIHLTPRGEKIQHGKISQHSDDDYDETHYQSSAC